MTNTKAFSAEVVDPQATERRAGPDDEVRDRFWRAVEAIGERNRHMDPDEVLAVVAAVVEEVRQERYEREQGATDGSR